MNKYLILAFSNPIDGREDEFNDWYSNQHIQDLLTVPGFVSAQRFKIATPPYQGPDLRFGYACLYEVETHSIEQTFDDIKAAAGSFTISDAIDFDGAHVSAYEPVTPVVGRTQ